MLAGSLAAWICHCIAHLRPLSCARCPAPTGTQRPQTHQKFDSEQEAHSNAGKEWCEASILQEHDSIELLDEIFQVQVTDDSMYASSERKTKPACLTHCLSLLWHR